MTFKYDTLSITKPIDHVLVLAFDRPDSANAINTKMAGELLDFFSQLSAGIADVRCVVMTGSGEKVFCAGGDLKERAGMTDEAWVAQHVLVERAILEMIDSPAPIIAAVNGAAFGGGCEFALNADFAYAASHARFALTETSLGIMPGAGGTQNLPRAAGMRRAKELIFTAKPFTAQEAAEWGIVNKVVGDGKLMDEVLATAKAISANAPLAVRQAKKSIQYGMEMDRKTALLFEVEAYNRLVPTQDRREGVLAFNEKRRPDFKGR